MADAQFEHILNKAANLFTTRTNRTQKICLSPRYDAMHLRGRQSAQRTTMFFFSGFAGKEKN
jgi:hypothetical protein